MRAINTSPVSPEWWRRYVDDSSACLKRFDVQLFHQHINSINPYIQFTVELPTSTPSGESIAFLDTKCTVRPEGKVNVNVYRKATHTNKYLSFQFYNPAQSKRALVKTLMDRAKSLPSTESDRRAEKDRVARDLQANGYTKRFIESSYATPPTSRKPDERPEPRKSIATIPYVERVSERVKKILNKANITTAFKPVRTLGTVVKKLKDRPPLVACKGIVYKVDCKSCDFTYIGKPKRSWNSRGPEHKPGTPSSNDSFIKQHAETTDHEVHPNYVQILERGVDNLSKRLFLESWHSTINTSCVNERKPFPRAYLPIVKAFK